MSYYMGDYYRGDPFWGALLSGASRIFTKVTSVGQKILAKGGGIFPGGNLPGPVKQAGETIQRAIIKHPVLSAAGAAGALGGAMGAGAERMMGGHPGARRRGTHPCKSKHGCKHGAEVPNRRMNPFNPRAARRAARRLHSLVRHYRKYVGFVSARKPKGRPFIKRRRK